MSTPNRTYSHTQIGYGILTSLALAILWILFLLVDTSSDGRAGTLGPRLILGAVILVLIAAGVVFSTLRIKVRDGVLSWSFGPGVLQREVALSDVCQATPVRNPWFYGLGVRFTPTRRLYNVSGLDAVEIVLANGTRFRLGTDEPDTLAQEIQRGSIRAGAPSGAPA